MTNETSAFLLFQTACEIPVSFEMEVKWTKYGSLVNPQAKIVGFTATVLTTTLPQVGGKSVVTERSPAKLLG